MKLSEFDPSLDPAAIGDADVVGVRDGRVLHFNAQSGEVYDAGLTIDDWLDGHPESWIMLPEEAARAGIVDCEAYAARVAELNPVLAGSSPRP